MKLSVEPMLTDLKKKKNTELDSNDESKPFKLCYLMSDASTCKKNKF